MVTVLGFVLYLNEETRLFCLQDQCLISSNSVPVPFLVAQT